MAAIPYIQANTNGRLHAAAEPSIAPLDRGFLYGDAIYEVWRTYHNTIFGWDEHWQRLRSSAAALDLPIPWAPAEILTEIRRTIAAYKAQVHGGQDVYIRLQITRGAGPIGLDLALAVRPGFVLLVQDCPRVDPAKLREGLSLSIARELRRNPVESLSPAWKTGNYLNNILGLREARGRGADEVVMLNLRGEVTEAAVSNIAFVAGGEIVTPPLDAGILAGVTRRLVFERVAPRARIPIREAVIRPDELGGMQECFVMSSTKDITPVARIDAASFAVGESTATAQLKREFARFTRDYAAAHPELAADITA